MPEGARFEDTEKADERIFKNDGRYCLLERHRFIDYSRFYRDFSKSVFVILFSCERAVRAYFYYSIERAHSVYAYDPYYRIVSFYR